MRCLRARVRYQGFGFLIRLVIKQKKRDAMPEMQERQDRAVLWQKIENYHRFHCKRRIHCSLSSSACDIGAPGC